MRFLEKGINWLFINIISNIMILFYIILIISLFLQVFTRFILKMPLFWTDELARYMFISMLFFGAGVGFFENSHIKLEFLTSRFPLKIQKINSMVIKIVIIAYLIIVTFKGFELIKYVYRQNTPALQISRAYPYLIIPIGSITMILGLIYGIIIENKN